MQMTALAYPKLVAQQNIVMGIMRLKSWYSDEHFQQNAMDMIDDRLSFGVLKTKVNDANLVDIIEDTFNTLHTLLLYLFV